MASFELLHWHCVELNIPVSVSARTNLQTRNDQKNFFHWKEIISLPLGSSQ